jgi:hypothetical protein
MSKSKLRTEPLDEIIAIAKAGGLTLSERAALYAAGDLFIDQVEDFLNDFGDKQYELDKLGSVRINLAGLLGFSAYDAPGSARFDVAVDQDWYKVTSAVA